MYSIIYFEQKNITCDMLIIYFNGKIITIQTIKYEI
jgi:hypothetical protein